MCCLLFDDRCWLLFAVWCLSCILRVCRWLFVVCPLVVGCWLLGIERVCCLLFVVCGSMFAVVCCLIYCVCCVL